MLLSTGRQELGTRFGHGSEHLGWQGRRYELLLGCSSFSVCPLRAPSLRQTAVSTSLLRVRKSSVRLPVPAATVSCLVG